MSFLYRAPLRLTVPAHIEHNQLHLRGRPDLLVKYRDERPRTHPAVVESIASFKAGCKPKELPVHAVWRADGRTATDPGLWKVLDLGPIPRDHGYDAHTRLARIEFHAELFTDRLHKASKAAEDESRKNQCNEDDAQVEKDDALYNAFLEHEIIQLQIELDFEAFHGVQAPDEPPRCLASVLIELDYR
jgi:hypothetical protein